MLKLSFLLLLVLINGCGKSPSMPESRHKSSGETLAGKTEEEVVELKYKEPFSLDCAVRTMKGEFINLNVNPVDQFNWQLDSDLSVLPFMRILHYKIGTTDMIIVVKAVTTPDIVPHVFHRTETYKEFEMENTPVLKIKYRRAPGKILLNGSVHDQNAYSEVTLFENIEQRIFTISSEVHDDLETDDFRCMLKTKINPKYADQWREVY